MKTWKSSSWIGLLTLSSVLLTGMQGSEYEASPELEKKWDLMAFGSKGRLNVKVLDNEGNALPGALIKSSYRLYKRPLFGGISGRMKYLPGSRPSGMTDANGRWHMEGQMPIGGRLYVEKEGFYKKTETFRFEDKTQLNSERGKWVPYERRKIVEMKRIVNPQPFYGVLRSYDRKIPVLDQPLGYDLRLGEFLPPYGKGEVADMTVMATCQCAPDAYFADAYTLTFAFPRPGDGIVRLEKRGIHPRKRVVAPPCPERVGRARERHQSQLCQDLWATFLWQQALEARQTENVHAFYVYLLPGRDEQRLGTGFGSQSVAETLPDFLQQRRPHKDRGRDVRAVKDVQELERSRR